MQEENIHYHALEILTPPSLAKPLARWLIGLFIAIIILLFLPWTQNVEGYGKVTAFNPINRPQEVQTIIAGKIAQWSVTEGQFVREGDTLLVLTEIKDKFLDPATLERTKEQLDAKKQSLSALEEKVLAQQSQLSALRSARLVSLQKAENKIRQSRLKLMNDSMENVAVRVEAQIAEEQFQRQKKLYDQGLKSLTELEQRRIKMQETSAKLQMSDNKIMISRQELQNSMMELNSIEAEYGDKIAKTLSELSSTASYQATTRSEVSKMQNEVSGLEIRNGFYTIRAPQDGYVQSIYKAGVGEMLKENETILILSNTVNTDIAAEIFVRPVDLPLLQYNSHVRLQFDGWPSLVFSGWPGTSVGTFGGRVKVINNTAENGKFRILVVPDSADVPWPVLPIGSGVKGWGLLNDVPVWYEVWRELNGFPPDFPSYYSPKSDADKKKK
ncbi:MAG: HlyD family secretion protein [Cytophagaceae bacterium]|jgi:multidrug resistance efflux pump|nr:HlyD family secretion protein [Cytophagaceae bacterium]